MRLKIFILTTMLITLISGVLFYKNLTQIASGKMMVKLDIEELRTIDLQISNSVFYLRKNINADLSELENERARVKELQELVNDINQNAPELKVSVEKIRTHFKNKQQIIISFEAAIKELRANVNSIIPTYNELDKKNIKFVLDKKDFYRECVLDSYMYLALSSKENEMRLSEDQKVLSQIINFSSTPVPELQKFATHLEAIHKKVKDIDYFIGLLRNENISEEVNIIAKYYQNSLEEQSQQNENLLTFMFAAIGIYILFMVFILRKT